MDETHELGLEPAYFEALADVPNVRAATFDDLEIKDGGNVFLFDGYAAVYGERADLGEFTEEIAAGAFKQVLAERRTCRCCTSITRTNCSRRPAPAGEAVRRRARPARESEARED
jgi:hypothetical protein